jgi:hypothetical protein
MAKTQSRNRSKKKPKTYQKKLSLYPLTLEQVVDTVLKYKPKSKTAKTAAV